MKLLANLIRLGQSLHPRSWTDDTVGLEIVIVVTSSLAVYDDTMSLAVYHVSC